MGTATTIDYAELLEQLQTDPASVTDEQLAEADAAIRTRLNTDLRPALADGSMTDEQYDEIIRLGEQLERIETATGERETASTERNARAQAVLDRTGGGEGDDPAGEPGEGEGDPGEGGGDAGDPGEGDPAPDAVAAGARPPMGAMRARGGAPAPRQATRAKVTLTAAADVSGFSAGQTIKVSDVPRALANRLNSIRGVRGGRGGDGEMLTVCTFTAEIPDERKLGSNIARNEAILDQFSGPQVITAAGVCAPFSVDYGIDVIGDSDEPIKASLPSFGAERAGVQFRRDMDAGGAGPVSATGEWTLDDDAKVGTADAPDPKPVWVVPCYPFVEAEVHAYTLQLEFSNVTTKFDPETTAAAERAALIAHARYCENRRLGTLLSGSKQLTVPDQISAVVDLLVALDKTQAYLRYRRRLNASAKLRMYLPQWVRDMIRADLTRGMRTASLEALAIADAAIDQWFANRNVNITWHLDGLPASTSPAVALQGYNEAAAGSVVPGFPDQVDAVLFPEGAWKRLDAGTLDLGVVRDSGLIENNRFRTFTESFEGVYHKGIESLRITASLQPTGMSAGTLDTSALTD